MPLNSGIRDGRRFGPSMGWIGLGWVELGHKFTDPLWVGLGHVWSNVTFL